jgi:hypothetical protein
VGWVCSIHRINEKSLHQFGWLILKKETGRPRHMDIGGKIILKWILEK